MAAGVELSVRVLSRASLRAVLDEEVPAAKVGARVEVTGTACGNIVSTHAGDREGTRLNSGYPQQGGL